MTHKLLFKDRFWSLFAIIFLLGLTGLSAQPTDENDSTEDAEEFDEYNFDNVPIDDYREYDYVGFGGGFQLSYLVINPEALNELATSFGLGDVGDIGKGILMYGGGGFIGGVGPKNFRFGFFGAGGSAILEETVKVNNQDYLRKLRFRTNTIAAEIDYAIFLPPEGLMLFPGILLGRETSVVEMSQSRASGLSFETLYDPDDFDGVTHADSTILNRYASIKRNSIHVRPMINLEYALSQFFVARIGGGYGLNVAGSWLHAAGGEVVDVPEGIKADGPIFNVGVFIGLFQK